MRRPWHCHPLIVRAVAGFFLLAKIAPDLARARAKPSAPQCVPQARTGPDRSAGAIAPWDGPPRQGWVQTAQSTTGADSGTDRQPSYEDALERLGRAFRALEQLQKRLDISGFDVTAKTKVLGRDLERIFAFVMRQTLQG